MPTTRYTVFDGEIVSESRAGVLHDYVSDPLGSTVALLDNMQTQTDQWTYFPYGESIRIKGTTATPMLFVGNKSCRQDSSTTRSYMEQRVLDMPKAKWMTQDPIGFSGSGPNLYPYVSNSPVTFTDPAGLYSCAVCFGLVFVNPLLAALCFRGCDKGSTVIKMPNIRVCAPKGWGPAIAPNVTPRPKDIPWSTCYTFCVTFMCVGPLSDVANGACDPFCQKLCNAQTRIHSGAEACHKTFREDNEKCEQCCEAMLGVGQAATFCELGCK